MLVTVFGLVTVGLLLEMLRLNVALRHERALTASMLPPERVDKQYERGNVLIHGACVVAVGAVFLYGGWMPAALAVVPSLLVGSWVDALWLKHCLHRPSNPF